MLKRIVLAIAVILPMSVFAQKFGVVDIEPIFEATPEYKTMETQLTEAGNKFQAEFQRLSEELNKLVAEYQTIANDPNTPESIKERRISDIQEREQKVNQFRATAQQDLDRLQQQLIEPIQKKIADAIQAVGQDGNFTFVFPNTPSLVLYHGADVVNITADVKAKLGLN